jgi:lipopolysaccharide/colanic/teichoic acid biosynthesis glycosyltransferase
MGTDRDAYSHRFVTICHHFWEGHGVTEPSAVDRSTIDPPAEGHRLPGRTNRKHLARAGWLRSSPDIVDLSRHISVAQTEDIAPVANTWAVLLARYERANRLLNIILAATALILLSPLLVLIALTIKLTSPGPILYTQIRVGRDHRFHRDRRLSRERRDGGDRRAGLDRRGRIERRAARNRRARAALATYARRCEDIGGSPIRIYKFRSMCVGAECGSGPVWATRNDSRVTVVGRVLRRFRLDELPQLINVLIGEMNIVGPRPERPSIFCRLRTEIPEYPLRQRVQPGITGWAQISHCYDSCVDDVRKKVLFDLEYLKRRSLWGDLRIMVRTIPVMIFRRGSV